MSLILLLYVVFSHPFKLSVTEININSTDSLAHISIRVFLDDFHVATGRELTDSLIKDYTIKHLKIKINDKPVELLFNHSQQEDDVLRIFLQSDNIKNLNTIEIRNTFLVEPFPEQINLVHVTSDKQTQSLKLTADQRLGSLRFNER